MFVAHHHKKFIIKTTSIFASLSAGTTIKSENINMRSDTTVFNYVKFVLMSD